jgi:surface protein
MYITNDSAEGVVTLTATITTDKGTKITATKQVYLRVLMTISLSSNQSADNNATWLAQHTATIKFDSTTLTAKHGNVIKVPANTPMSITFSSFADYKAPTTQNITTSTSNLTISGVYQTEVVNVNISAEEGETLPSSVPITINGKEYTWSGSAVTAKVPFGVTYDVVFGVASGLNAPSTQSFTANSVNRSVSGEYTGTPNEYTFIYKSVFTNVTDAYIVSSTYDVSKIKEMWINGNKVEVKALQQVNPGENTIRIVMYNSFNSTEGLFAGKSSIISLDVSKLRTNNVTNMYGTFAGCSALTSLDLSNWDTSNATDMGGMFRSCSALTSLDLSSFNTSKATYMKFMFDDCSSLTSLDLSSFDTSSVTNIDYMFSGCKNLKTIKLGDMTANTKASKYTFGNSYSSYVGYNSRSTGENKLYVPVGATGYDTGYWLDPLQNTSKCGFTVVYSL